MRFAVRWIYKVPLRLRSLFRKSHADHELDGELQFHLQSQIDEYIAQGMDAEDARYAALRSLGGVEQIKEECRDMRNTNWWEHFAQDLRFALRTFIKAPGFTAVAIATLALGIGANTAIFSLVNGILIRPLPYAEPDRLVGLWNLSCPKGALLEFGQRLKTVDLGAFTFGTGVNLSGDGEAIRLNGSGVSTNLFPMLGVKPELGRWFTPGDEQPGKSRLVILSHGLWQTRFGGDTKIVGRSIVMDEVSREVVGVMPASFRFPNPESQFWMPIEINTADRKTLWGPFLYTLFGRLRPGVQLSTAQAELKATVPQAIQAYPWPMGDKYASWATLSPLQEQAVGAVRPTLLILLGAVALVLLVACANVANLLLARASARQREIAVRTALGASRNRILRQLLTESAFLALLGGVFGSLVAMTTLAGLRSFLPSDTPGLVHANMDLSMLFFCIVLALFTALAFGLAPAWQASRSDTEQSLKTNSQSGTAARSRTRLSAALVIGEVALAVILVGGAGLLVKSLWKLSQIRTGFRPDHVLTAQLTPTVAFCAKHNSCVDFYRELVEQLRAQPGVKDAAIADSIPLTNLPGTALAVEDRPELSVNSPLQVWEFTVSPGYLGTMQIPLLRGRNFDDQDNEKSPRVVLISKTLAQFLWPNQDPINKRVKPSWQADWRTVIGVVDDVAKYKALSDKTTAEWVSSVVGDVYFPAAQGIVVTPTHAAVTLRVDGNVDLGAMKERLSKTVASFSPAIPISKVRSMDQIVSDSVAAPRSVMWIFVCFAGLALFLGAIGIYGVISYSVAQRTREIGIRMALGAQRRDVLKMVLRQGSALTLAGLALGIAGALALTRLMASLLYGVSATDPLTFTVVSAVVGVAATVATYIPSRRATRVNPTLALKYE
ncbi:MAG TPA: ABC transporter permease [Alphaproteobacteria bacterium]|nr:ABC transporter permease [Alphaproteobacteria bacterium]